MDPQRLIRRASSPVRRRVTFADPPEQPPEVATPRSSLRQRTRTTLARWDLTQMPLHLCCEASRAKETDSVYLTATALLWVPKQVERAFLEGIAVAAILLVLSLLLTAWLTMQNDNISISPTFIRILAGSTVLLVLGAIVMGVGALIATTEP